MKKGGEIAAEEGPNVGTELTFRSVWSVIGELRELTLNSVSCTSSEKLKPCPVNAWRNIGKDWTQFCIWS